MPSRGEMGGEKKVLLPRKAQRGYYLLLRGYQRLEGLVHGSKLLLQLPGSAGGAAGIDQRTRPVPVASGPGNCLTTVHSAEPLAVPFPPPGYPYLSATSALSSERSSSPSRITSFLAT